MNRKIADRSAVCLIGLGLGLSGCATPHYMVKDPQSGNVYYTQNVDNLTGGSVKLNDARTGSTVTLQSSEVKEISSEAYKEGIAAPKTQPASTAAPAAAVPPATAPAATTAPAPAPEAQPSPTPSGTK